MGGLNYAVHGLINKTRDALRFIEHPSKECYHTDLGTVAEILSRLFALTSSANVKTLKKNQGQVLTELERLASPLEEISKALKKDKGISAEDKKNRRKGIHEIMRLREELSCGIRNIEQEEPVKVRIHANSNSDPYLVHS